MSNNINYLLDLLSLAWSKLAAFQTAGASSHPGAIKSEQIEQYKLDYPRKQVFYTRFTDRVDPSLYYTIFNPYTRN